ncbi:MAG TPA: hypothetical protein DCL15_02120 [Chloroflexi bacterium]|nr:hypothetical protein [Chloroflexota bacterium]HHW88332.1 hypothetical protein [Chloroflexota bacterium]
MKSRHDSLRILHTNAHTWLVRALLLSLLTLACGAVLAPLPVHAQSADLPFAPDVNGPVYAIAVQADGKILIGGSFTQVNGVGQAYLARLWPDGRLDVSFTPSLAKGTANFVTVYSILLLDNSEILVGGEFGIVNGQQQHDLARFTPTGQSVSGFSSSTDQSAVYSLAALPGGDFVAGLFLGVRRYDGNGQVIQTLATTNNPVRKVAPQSDGRLMVGGSFTTINSSSRPYLARLQSNGALDATFSPSITAPAFDIRVVDDGYIVGSGSSNYAGIFANVLKFTDSGGVLAEFHPPTGSNYTSAIEVLPDGNILAVGTSATPGVWRLYPGGAYDTAFPSLAINNYVHALAVLPDGQFVIGGDFTTVNGQPRNRIARLSPQGYLETSMTSAANDVVYAMSARPEGRIIVGGAFTTLDAQPRDALARITPTATVDSAFTPTVTGAVYSLLALPDDQLLVGGAFNAVNGSARANLARLLPNAALDTTFAPNPNGPVYSLLRQADGSVLVAGNFTQIGSGSVARLARLDAGGALDPTFAPNPSATVRTLAQQRDGKLVIGGAFTSVSGQPANRLARLTSAGAFDAGFSASATGGDVYAVLVQPDGKIVVGGAFTQINGQPRPYLARLEANGALDTSFAPTTTVGGPVYALALQPDGRLIAGGAFTSVTVDGAPVTRNRLARFDADGGLDMSWDANANDTVYAVALLPDGKVLVGGAFTTIGGQLHGRIARLSSDLSASQTLTVASDGDSVTWTQTGAGPELTAVHFYSSTDNLNFVALGEGARLDTGWTITNVALPMGQNVWVKAYGEYPGGQSNGSTSASASVRLSLVRASDVLMDVILVGGASQSGDWMFTAGGKQVAGDATLRVNPGSYTVTYTGPSGYTLTGVGGACSLASNAITLNAALGANTCTFTFTRDTGAITFVKTVEGGTAQATDFTFTVLTQTVNHNQTVMLETGLYTITESGPTGYVLRAASGACALVNGAIQLTVTKVGGVCNVYNAWPITLVKQVSGGQATPGDWSFTISGQTLAPGSQVVLPPGTYEVSESGPANYTLYSASGDCAIQGGGVQLTVPAGPGGAGVCTITNRRDTGQILFYKVVEGGTAQPSDFSFDVLTYTVPHGQVITLETGLYTVTEHSPLGYELRTANGTCDLVNGALQLIVTKSGGTCTVHNTWPVTFAKVVEGGDALPAQWSFTVNGQTISPTASLLLAPGSYPVVENGPERYTLVGASGDCALVDGAAVLTVPSAPGGTGQCTLTNRRDTGTITFHTNVEGEGAVAGNFTYSAAGRFANGDGGQLILPTESYTLTIEGPAGFAPRVASGVCTLVNGTVQLAVEKAGGECAVTMTHVVKFVNVVEGGTRSPYSWSLRLGDILVYHNRTVLLAPGIYTPTVQGNISIYRLVEARDACAFDPSEQTLTLTAPGNGLCTIVHRRTTGIVTFKRVVQGGNAQPSDWVTMVNGQPMPLDTPVTLDTNTYTVIESGPPDYVVTAASGICALDKGQIKLTVTEEGGECGLISTRGIGPVGFVMYPGGGTAQASEWSFIVNGQVVPHNGALLMPVGLYTVTVQGPAGYTVIGASGICVLTESHDVQMTVGVEGGTCNLQSAYDASGVGAISFYAAPSDDAPPELWNFVANGQMVDHGQTLLMPVGVYTVTVNSPTGYSVTGATGVCALVDGSVRLTVTVFGGSCTVQTAPDAGPPPQADFALYLPAVTR